MPRFAPCLLRHSMPGPGSATGGKRFGACSPVRCLLASTGVHPRRAASLLPIRAPSEAWNSLSDICRDSEIITLTDGLLLSPSLSFISAELTRYAVNFPRRMKHGASRLCLLGRRGPAHNGAVRTDPKLLLVKGGWNLYHPSEPILLSALSAQHLMN